MWLHRKGQPLSYFPGELLWPILTGSVSVRVLLLLSMLVFSGWFVCMCVWVCSSDLAAVTVAALDLSSLKVRSELSLQFKSMNIYEKAEITLRCTDSD